MQKPEKQSEASMEEILSSIRKIIAEEPQTSPAAPAEPTVEATAPSIPPVADLSDLLGELPTAPSESQQPQASVTEAPQAPQEATSDWPFARSIEEAKSAVASEIQSIEPVATPEPEPEAATAEQAAAPRLADSLANLASQSLPNGPDGSVEHQGATSSSEQGEFADNLVARLRGFEPSPSPRFGSLANDEATVDETKVQDETTLSPPTAVADSEPEIAPTSASAAAFGSLGTMADEADVPGADVAAEAPFLDAPTAQGLKAIEEVGLPVQADAQDAAGALEPATQAQATSPDDVGEPLLDTLEQPHGDVATPKVAEAKIASLAEPTETEPAPLPHTLADPAEDRQTSDNPVSGGLFASPFAPAVSETEPTATPVEAAVPAVEPAASLFEALPEAELETSEPAAMLDPVEDLQVSPVIEREVIETETTSEPAEPAVVEEAPNTTIADVAAPMVAAAAAAAVATNATAPATPTAAVATQPEGNGASQASIESALTALMKPLVENWLEENAPALFEAAVQKAIAEDEGQSG